MELGFQKHRVVVFGEDFEDGGEGLFGGLLGGVVGLGHGCWWFGLEKG